VTADLRSRLLAKADLTKGPGRRPYDGPIPPPHVACEAGCL